MPDRQFEIFEPADAAVMRAAYHEACTVMQNCTDEERAAIVGYIIELAQSGERDPNALARNALARLRAHLLENLMSPPKPPT